MSKPVGVLFLDDTGYLGGAEISMLRLASHLDPERIRPVVSCPESPRLAKIYRDRGFTVYPNDLDRLKKNYLQIFPLIRFWRRLRRVIREESLRVAHCNTLWAYCLCLPVFILTRTPAVCMIHSFPPIRNRLKRWIFGVFNRIALRQCTAFVTVSEFMLAHLRAHGGFPVDHLHMCYDGVPESYFTDVRSPTELRSRLGLPGDAVVISCISRVHPGKGHRVLLEAAKSVIATHAHVYFLIAGEELVTPLENLAFTEELKDQIRRNQIEDKVVFAGFLEDPLPVFLTSDIIVQPSLTEPFGLSILESLATGTAVIASHTGGLPEIVRNGETGMLCRPGDPGELAGAMTHLVDHPEFRKQLGRAGRIAVRRRFPMNRRLTFMTDLYETVARGDSPASGNKSS